MTAAPQDTGDAPERPGGRWLRLRGLIGKEYRQILRDPSSILVAFVLPVILLLMFGFGVSLDARDVPVAVVVESPTSETASFTASLINSRYFAARVMRTTRAAEQALIAGDVQAIVTLRSDFSRRVRSASGVPIQVAINGTDANTAGIVTGYLDGIWQNWLVQTAAEEGRDLAPPVLAQPRVWFNAELRSRNFLVPGLIAIIMTLIGALLTAMVIAREWERGTMEALLVTPVRIGEMIFGKLVPYFTLGMGGMALSTVMAVWVFGVPLRGSVIVLTLVSALYMLTALGMGMLISTVARSQFVAGQVAILTAFLPAFILSGFLFDIASMPVVLQFLTQAVPARYFVSSLQTLFLAGTIWPVVLANGAALLVMTALFLGLTRRKMRKALE